MDGSGFVWSGKAGGFGNQVWKDAPSTSLQDPRGLPNRVGHSSLIIGHRLYIFGGRDPLVARSEMFRGCTGCDVIDWESSVKNGCVHLIQGSMPFTSHLATRSGQSAHLWENEIVVFGGLSFTQPVQGMMPTIYRDDTCSIHLFPSAATAAAVQQTNDFPITRNENSSDSDDYDEGEDEDEDEWFDADDLLSDIHL